MSEWDFSKWTTLTEEEQQELLEKYYPNWQSLSKGDLNDAWEDVIIGVVSGRTLNEKIDHILDIMQQNLDEQIIKDIQDEEAV